MEEIALEIPKPTRCNERDRLQKTTSSATLLCGDETTNEIFDTPSNTLAGEGDDLFEKAAQALTNYFTPRQNRECEIRVFRQAK